MGNVNMEASQINDRTGSNKMSVAQHLKALDALAQQIEDMPAYTSSDRAWLDEWEEKLPELPADPEADGVKVLTATTESGETVKSWEDLSGGSFNYSTSEFDTGQKWIDGKKIYGKVVELGALPNATTKTVAHNITNINEWIKVIGTANNTSNNTGISIPLVYDGNNSVNNTRLAVNDTNVVLETDTDRSSFNKCSAILFYTKSTT